MENATITDMQISAHRSSFSLDEASLLTSLPQGNVEWYYVHTFRKGWSSVAHAKGEAPFFSI